MVTGDKNLSHQQNLKKGKLALVVLATNDWNVIKQNPTPALVAVHRAVPEVFRQLVSRVFRCALAIHVLSSAYIVGSPI